VTPYRSDDPYRRPKAAFCRSVLVYTADGYFSCLLHKLAECDVCDDCRSFEEATITTTEHDKGK
jgi:hypothetical protein